MEEALQRSQDSGNGPGLKVSVLLDYTRGSRGRGPLLGPLLTSDPVCRPPERVRVVLRRTDQLADDAPAAAAALLDPGSRVSVPHPGPEGAAAARGSPALQRDHRGPAHQSLPV